MEDVVTAEQLAKFTLFQAIAEDDLTDLSHHCERLRLKPGEELFKQGDPAENLYLIESGEVALIRAYDNGDEIVLARLGPNEVIGELSMMVGEGRTATGVTLQTTQLIVLHHDKLFEYLNAFPSVARALLVQLATRLRNTNLLVREWALENAEARVASLILFLAEEDGRIRTGLIHHNMHPSRLARTAGVDVDWLRQTLREWANAGYIGMDGRRMLLHDVDALTALAGWR